MAMPAAPPSADALRALWAEQRAAGERECAALDSLRGGAAALRRQAAEALQNHAETTGPLARRNAELARQIRQQARQQHAALRTLGELRGQVQSLTAAAEAERADHAAERERWQPLRDAIEAARGLESVLEAAA